MAKKTTTQTPRHCKECEYFRGATTEWGKKYGFDTCTAQGFNGHTYGFTNPLDCPMPPIINCIYMEQNGVFKRLPDRRKEGYIAERNQRFAEQNIIPMESV